MAGLIAHVILAVLYSLLGGLFIGMAVDNFKAHRYFLFGFDLMVAAYHCAYIIKLVFER